MEFRAIGLMSGTSLDGLDLCFVKFKKESERWTFEILNAETSEYSKSWEDQLRNSIHRSAPDLLELNSNYGFYLGEKVQEFISKKALENIDVISSHGHTVFHQPQNKFTCQIGDGRAIKHFTQIPVVYDFRSQDVLMGGNGAPLVPIGDELLFSEYDACLNLGGFSNISFKEENKRIAFDIGPLNIVLNHFAKLLGKDYDENGDIAKSGFVSEKILADLNSLDYYLQSPPKSLGLEWVNQNVFPLLTDESPENNLATFTQHAAEKITEVFRKYKLNRILFTGGGTYNQFLFNQIKENFEGEIIIPSQELINFKEALIFAFMGVLKINNETNVLSSATGSSADHSSGLLV
ncbi:anhydro-N-acetylmuramic acid kinase [Chryseobacterium sp. MP_3.2]|uniref:anhydro-N-acetylmuramic acid kinase n=1 Tax=Chryseobacterium sp. MP_3.2 TaxID=3071712 RepID=UPI002DFADDF7|nr:anhydro-N-acetylmuramic acid kinase [Chryseobacterium sp. MP_3.2]